MEYDVRITVERVLIVPVLAESMAKAKLIAEQNWWKNEYDLADANSKTIKFETLYPGYSHLIESASYLRAPGEQGLSAASAETEYKHDNTPMRFPERCAGQDE